MPWRPHGHARVDPQSPSAFGVCDRCGFLYNLDDLRFQFAWRGPRLMNIRLLVCEPCYDKPTEQRRPIVLPPDPVPRTNPRPEGYASEDQGISAAQSATPPGPGTFGFPVED